MNLLDESGRQKLLDFLANDLALFLVESAQPLLHWLGTGSNLQGVLGDFPWYARHIRGTPCKHISIRTEKVDEHGFLFGVEVGADCQHLAVGVVGVERDLLSSFRRLEAARMTFRFWSLSGHGFELRNELGGALDRLPVLDALDVALVRVLEGRTDGDDAFGTRHLQLQVCVVGYSHELRVARASDDGVVRASEPNHLKGEGLLPEVGRRAEADR